MPTAGLRAADTASWLHLLDAGERRRAARFVFERHRTTFIAAHVLARCVLSRVDAAVPPSAWRFVPGEHGKPVAWAPMPGVPADQDPTPDAPDVPPPPGYEPARLTFNLSHTDGLVGLATMPQPGQRLGFDVEPVARPVNLDVADRFFRPEETSWLHALPEAGRAEGFLRLWTLKEAFIKATGEGLARDLASFWFRVPDAAIHFVSAGAPALDDRSEDPAVWQFEQRMIGGDHLAAVGLHRSAGSTTQVRWLAITSEMLNRNAWDVPDR